MTTFLVDLDNTLLDFNATQNGALSKLHQAYFRGRVSWEVFDETYTRINHRLWKQVANSELTQDVLRVERFRELICDLSLDPKYESAGLADTYEDYMAQIAVFLPGAKHLVDLLSDMGNLVIATNGIASVQRRRLQLSGLDSTADLVWIGQERGVAKPDPAFYLRAISSVGGTHKNSVAIGDLIETDGVCAYRAGIPFWWFNPNGAVPVNPIPEREYHTLFDMCKDVDSL